MPSKNQRAPLMVTTVSGCDEAGADPLRNIYDITHSHKRERCPVIALGDHEPALPVAHGRPERGVGSHQPLSGLDHDLALALAVASDPATARSRGERLQVVAPACSSPVEPLDSTCQCKVWLWAVCRSTCCCNAATWSACCRRPLSHCAGYLSKVVVNRRSKSANQFPHSLDSFTAARSRQVQRVWSCVPGGSTTARSPSISRSAPPQLPTSIYTSVCCAS